MTTKKRGLGRGLDALLQSDENAVRSLPIQSLRPNRRQPRVLFDDDSLEELAASIRAQGVVQPLIVTPDGEGKYLLVAGERRWRAAQKAGLASVPVVVRAPAGDRELLELALVENLQRADLNPLEEAEAYRVLHDEYGLSHEDIALRVGKTRAAVANAVRLLRLPTSLQDLLRAGKLSAGQARPLLALDPKSQELLGSAAAAQGLSAREVERRAASRSRPPKSKARKQPEANAADAAERLTQRWQTRVEIVRSGPRGTVRIHFGSEDELIRIFDMLMQRGGAS
jgi:ParB family transcriptional regulator, chromosome partitioning protein